MTAVLNYRQKYLLAGCTVSKVQRQVNQDILSQADQFLSVDNCDICTHCHSAPHFCMGTVLDGIRGHVLARNRAICDSRLFEFFPKYDRCPFVRSSFQALPMLFCHRRGIFANSALYILNYYFKCSY